MLRDVGNKLKLFGVVDSLYNNAWQIAAFVVLSVVSVVLNIAKPIIFSRIIDTGLIEQDWSNVLYYCIAFSVIAVVISVNSLGYGMITSLVSNRFAATLKKSLINRIFLLDYHFFNRTHGGDILTRLKSDTDNIRSFFMAILNNSMVSFLGFLSAMIYVGVVEWKMLIPGFAVVPFLIWRTHAFRDRIHAANTRVLESESQSTEQIASGIDNIMYLRQICLHGWSLRKITASFDRFQDDSIKLDRWNLMSETSISLIMAAGYIVTVGYGGWLVVDDQLTVGSLLAFLTLRQRFTAPMQFVSQTYHGFINARAAFERLWDFYANPIEVGINRSAEEPIPDFDKLSIEDVRFRYQEEGNGLEGHATFIRGWNEVYGSNGSGKTTLIRLLMKLLTPQKGRVAVDDRDISHINNHAWRNNISIVPQHTYLFNESVRENIRLFDDRINDDMICEVLGRLNAKDDFVDCAQGLDAEIVEGGKNLSGGQRQKIAIARALLRNTPVYILDEPFVHIDKETKDRIGSYLHETLCNRIVIYISHDDFGDFDVDNRIHIRNGRIRTMSMLGELV